MNPQSESYVINLKLTPAQHQWLDNAAKFIEAETGCPVSHSSIMIRMVEIGLPHFEGELQSLRAKANAQKKRFPKLELVLSK